MYGSRCLLRCYVCTDAIALFVFVLASYQKPFWLYIFSSFTWDRTPSNHLKTIGSNVSTYRGWTCVAAAWRHFRDKCPTNQVRFHKYRKTWRESEMHRTLQAPIPKIIQWINFFIIANSPILQVFFIWTCPTTHYRKYRLEHLMVTAQCTGLSLRPIR